MKLIVGLGNPGPKYETTRHNAGFLAVDLLAARAGASWTKDLARFHGETGRGTLLGEACVFLKPLTFMNLSGRSVGAVMRFYKIEPNDIIVLFDDVDVPAGKVRARVGGGHGGHNGVRNILEEAAITDFHRIKLGVGRPPEGMDTIAWVLGAMTDAELQSLKEEMLKDVDVRLKQIFDHKK